MRGRWPEGLRKELTLLTAAGIMSVSTPVRGLKGANRDQ